jgi:hypothetical protein
MPFLLFFVVLADWLSSLGFLFNPLGLSSPSDINAIGDSRVPSFEPCCVLPFAADTESGPFDVFRAWDPARGMIVGMMCLRDLGFFGVLEVYESC